MKEIFDVFIIESIELLHVMEDELLGIETNPHQLECINAIFRAIHTIKGSSEIFGLNHIVHFAHAVETLLDSVRSGNTRISSQLIAHFLACRDHLAMLINVVAGGNLQENSSYSRIGQKLLDQLQLCSEGASYHQAVQQSFADTPIDQITSHLVPEGDQEITKANWHISLRFATDCLREGMDPLAFLRYLKTIGSIVQLTTISIMMPAAEAMDPESNYLGFEVDFNTDASKTAIESIFEFVRTNSQICLTPSHSCIDEFIALIDALPEDNEFIGELLVNSGVINQVDLQQALCQQQVISTSNAELLPLGEILVEQQSIQQPPINAALDKPKQIHTNKSKENQGIRVDAERLDKLIDLIGELVISSAGVNLRALMNGNQELIEATNAVMRLIEEVRDNTLQLRMVPIGKTFSRFPRIVRDVGLELGKEVDLIITGGETEVDKSVIEKIADPLIHLIRNSMDHGIEYSERRQQSGKPIRGCLRLNAYHDSGSIAIEVIDDGAGLNRDLIINQAIENGLLSSGENLSDQEIYALIFEPGFSTAQEIRNLSGRGIGMDVVQRNVNDLRGVIEVESQLNVGTTIRIRLPLTLAIIEGFLVGVGASSFVIPLDRVVECVELPGDLDFRQYIDLRGEVLPVIRIRTLFNLEDNSKSRENVVIVEYAGVKTGFIVDSLKGEFQTVIKPLGNLFQHIKGVSGSTILGNGKVALILDVPVLVSLVNQRKSELASHNSLACDLPLTLD